MSKELDHEEARIGTLVLHDNGSIYYQTVHHVSWIDDAGKRVVLQTGVINLLTETERADLQKLAARHDSKGAK